MIGPGGQLELAFTTKKGANAPSADEVAELIAFLERCEGWVFARAIPGGQTESGRRRLRALARASKGEIIGGDEGYNLTRRVGASEFHESRARLAKMRDDMSARISELDRVFHRNPSRA